MRERAPRVLWVRPRIREGFVAGLVLALPLALWARATACTWSVQLTYLVSASLQDALLAWISDRPSGERTTARYGR